MWTCTCGMYGLINKDIFGQNGKENETAKDQTFIYTNYIHKPSRHKGTTLQFGTSTGPNFILVFVIIYIQLFSFSIMLYLFFGFKFKC